jgi:hypothetical protein
VLHEKKVGDELISEFIRKINSKGLAFCERCQDINYATLEAIFHYRSSCPILNFEYKVSKSEAFLASKSRSTTLDAM